jgi:hypothetical protein
MYSLADFFLNAHRLVLVRTLGWEVPFFGLVSVCVLKVERGKYSHAYTEKGAAVNGKGEKVESEVPTV